MGEGASPPRAELAFSRAIQNWPAYPEPYQMMVDLLLEQDRALLSDGEWGQSLQKAEQKAMEICAAAESADDVMDADLWQQYVSQLELLLPAETE